MNVELSLVVPAYNEEPRLRAGFERLSPILEILGPSNVEIIVIDDGSSDATMQRAHEVYGHLEHARFVQQPHNRGKGAALRLGMALAQGANVVTLDADMSINPEHLTDFVTTLRENDVAPGTRALGGRIHYDSPLRSLAGSLFNRVVRHYTATTLRDTQCGSKGFQLGTARLLALLAMTDGFAFDVEALYLARELELRIATVAVTWQDVRGSSVRPARDAWAMIKDIRTLRATRYENPVVELPSSVRASEIVPLAREARLVGSVLARSNENTLLVVARDAAPAAVGIAAALSGTLRTAPLDELRGRHLDAV